MSSTPNVPGQEWTRAARRSAPARLNAYSPTSAAPARVRDRYAATKHVQRQGLNPSEIPKTKEGKGHRRKKPSSTASPNSDASNDVYSPVSRTRTGGLSRVDTAELSLGEEDGESDSSYNSFNLSLQKKALFFEEETTAGFGLSDDGQFANTQSAGHGKADDRQNLAAVYRVYRSFYEGDYFENGNLTANLTTGTNRKLFQGELSRPLFRWV
jgi:hypothetical protein